MQRETTQRRGIFGGIARWFPSRRPFAEVASKGKLRILAVMKDGPNGRLLGTIAADAGWCLTISETPSAMSFRRGSDVPAIVIFDRRLSPERWTCVVELLAQNSPRPYVILLSPSMDANLWDEVERVGGSDILRDPIDHDRLIETLERAWRVWLSQQQVRNPPAGR